MAKALARWVLRHEIDRIRQEMELPGYPFVGHPNELNPNLRRGLTFAYASALTLLGVR